MERMFLDELPTNEKGHVKYGDMVGKGYKFMYNEIEDIVYINKYEKGYLNVSCADVKDFKIKCCHFKDMKFRKLLQNHVERFEFPIGYNLKDENRNLTIIDREFCEKDGYQGLRKWYKYICNDCDYSDWREESALKKNGCPVCKNKTIILGINTIWDTDRWMCDLGVSEEDAKKYVSQSNKPIIVTCPDCGNKKEVKINNIYNRKSISCVCSSTGFSYPEKFMTSILKQLDIEYKTQYSPDYLDGRRSDFYIMSKNIVIEMDGELGHEGGTMHKKSNKYLSECIEVDRWKDEQHKLHGIETVRINSFKSEMEYIRDNILNSKLSEIFNFDNVSFEEADLFACGENLVKMICEEWNNRSELDTSTTIAKKNNISKYTLLRYIKIGVFYGWCEYNIQEEYKRRNKKVGMTNGKPIKAYKDGIEICEVYSASELNRRSVEILGIETTASGITKSAKSGKPYKGFTFKYTEQLNNENQGVA